MSLKQKEEQISWSSLLEKGGIFDNIDETLVDRRSKKIWAASSFVLILFPVAILLLIVIGTGGGPLEVAILIYATCVFPALEAYVCCVSLAPIRSLVSALHMIVFIEVLYFFDAWHHGHNVIFFTTIACLRLFLTGDYLFPATICTISTLQCLKHGDVTGIAVVFTYAFLTLSLCFHRILLRQQCR